MTENIELTFLGTGSAIPTKRRNHPAMLLKYKTEDILIDCGEGTQRQFRKARLNPTKINKILITHWHGDHTFGLPGILQTLILNGHNRELKIYGPEGTKNWIRKYFDLVGRGVEKLNIEVIEVGDEIVFDNDEYFVESKKVDHGCPAVGYSFTIREKSRIDTKKLKELNIPNSPLIAKIAKGETVEINGKEINGKDLLYKEKSRKITIVMDTRYTKSAVNLAKESDLLITESTYSKEESKTASDYGHMTSIDAAKMAKMAKVKSLALIHLSQRYEAIPKVILNEAKEIFEDTIIPEDLDKIIL